MILITGASSGIGEACARVFSEHGHRVWLLGRREERLQQLKFEIEAKGGQALISPIDITCSSSMNEWIKNHKKEFKAVEVLVNNAGKAVGLKTFDEVEEEEWDQMIDLNVKALLKMTKVILPFMLEKGDGHIVNLGSVAGHHVYPRGNVYCATKHAVHALSQALRVDLVGKGIRVTEISPGMVETEFSEVRLNDKEKARAVYSGMTPLTARDVAETIYWSVSRPKHVNIEEIILYPTAQASPTLVSRK